MLLHLVSRVMITRLGRLWQTCASRNTCEQQQWVDAPFFLSLTTTFIMAHSFLFPPSNYPQTYADELYSPLNTLNDPLSRTDFSRTLTRTNSVSFGSNLSQNAPIYYTSAFDSPITLQQPRLIHTSAVLALRIRTRLQRLF